MQIRKFAVMLSISKLEASRTFQSASQRGRCLRVTEELLWSMVGCCNRLWLCLWLLLLLSICCACFRYQKHSFSHTSVHQWSSASSDPVRAANAFLPRTIFFRYLSGSKIVSHTANISKLARKMLVRTVQWFVWKHSTFKFDGWSSVFLFKKYFKLPF